MFFFKKKGGLGVGWDICVWGGGGGRDIQLVGSMEGRREEGSFVVWCGVVRWKKEKKKERKKERGVKG